MELTKKIVATILGLSMALVALPASGQTVAELQAQISALLAQIATLQTQISALGGAPAAGACSFTRNLSVGVRGDDVTCLQNYLMSAGRSIPAGATSYFGSQTQAAVASWQAANGVSPAAGYFGPISQSKYSSLVAVAPGTPTTPATPTTPTPTPGITTPGKEGSLTLTANATPPTGETIYTDAKMVAVAGWKIKALSSDVQVDRLDVNFDTRPWLNMANAALYDGSTKLVTMAVTQSNTIEVTAGSSYTIRFSGFNWVVPDGVEKVLTLQIDPILQAGDTTETLTYRVQANGARGTDGKAIQQYAPTAALSDRTFVVNTRTGALTLSVNAATPKERAVAGSVDAITEGVEMLRLDLKATVGDVVVEQINTASLLDNADVLQTLKLYDGSTVLAATSVTSGQAHVFKPINIKIPKDTTKTLVIKADTEKATEARIAGSSSVSVATGGVTAKDASTFSALTVSGSTATGKKVHLYTIAPELKLVSTSIATNRAGRTDGSNTISADAKIRFEVTARGGDIYMASTTPGNTTTTASVAGIQRTETASWATNAETSGQWVVRNGATNWFEVSTFISNASPTATFLYAYLSSTTWGTSSASDTLARNFKWDWTDLQNDFKTSSVYLQATN
ncbi:MAG: SpoIID/LytB protein [Parcubacteria group bacterium Gr01-1014_30]|nr:MAG: SpoIID/LytB protein [Parcubacteria group bacterium Gr01-1014_30]